MKQVCGNCRLWHPWVGQYLGHCMKKPYTPLHNADGEIIRENCTRGSEQYACWERQPTYAERQAIKDWRESVDKVAVAG